MASQTNMLKLLQSLGGMASESYGQGSSMLGQQRKGGQPLLPKPTVSMPHNLSPYAPGNQGGGPYAQLGGRSGEVPGEMHNSSHHPAAQLAEYLATSGGAPTTGSGLKIHRVDAGAFIRGAQ
jgi:hypothetical protein